MSDNFEKFMTSANEGLDAEIRRIQKKNSSDSMIYSYILTNKNKLRSMAATMDLNSRQYKMVNYIEDHLEHSGVVSYNKSTIRKGLNKIGIVACERIGWYAGIIYTIISISICTFVFFINSIDSLTLYILSAWISLAFSSIGGLFTAMALESTNFRYFRVKKYDL